MKPQNIMWVSLGIGTFCLLSCIWSNMATPEHVKWGVTAMIAGVYAFMSGMASL